MAAFNGVGACVFGTLHWVLVCLSGDGQLEMEGVPSYRSTHQMAQSFQMMYLEKVDIFFLQPRHEMMYLEKVDIFFFNQDKLRIVRPVFC
jgi:hypothetical protein